MGLRFFQVFNKTPDFEKEVKIVGKVNSEPVIIGQSQYFSLDQFRIKTKIFPKYHYGDVLEISGNLNEKSQISYPKVKKIGQNRGLVSFIFTLRQFLISQAGKIWPQPEAALLTGVILGQDTIPTEFRENLTNTGTIHVVVVSGQNVAMLAGFMLIFLGSFFKRRTLGFLVILAIIFYTLLTGSQPPTVRAAIMGALAFVAKIAGRENWDFLALALASFLMLFFSPKLIANISFQLSVAATFGILFATPTFSKLFSKFPKFLSDALSVTIAAWIFTAPIIAFYFSKFTPITPISNLLVVPVVPFLMVAGVANLIIAFFNLFLARIFALVPFAAAAYFTFVIEKLSQIPFATISVPSVNIFLILSFYVFVILTIKWSQRRYLAHN